jgi:hypothetical protein
VIGRFKHSDEREARYIREILTLDVATDIDVEVPAGLDDRQVDGASALVEPFVLPAFVALQHFIESYRDVRYNIDRSSPRWEEQRGVFVERMSLLEFKTFLFYTLVAEAQSFIGVFSGGRVLSTVGEDVSLQESLRVSLAVGVPFERLLILQAWDSLFLGDFRSAVIHAATVVELALDKIVTAHLTARSAGTKTDITKFVRETSNRLIATVLLSLFKVGSGDLREGTRNTLETRNGLLHGGIRYASERQARLAIHCAERLVEEANKLKV